MLWVNNANGIKHEQTQEQRSRSGMEWAKSQKSTHERFCWKIPFQSDKINRRLCSNVTFAAFLFSFRFLVVRLGRPLEFRYTRTHLYHWALYTNTLTESNSDEMPSSTKSPNWDGDIIVLGWRAEANDWHADSLERRQKNVCCRFSEHCRSCFIFLRPLRVPPSLHFHWIGWRQ